MAGPRVMFRSIGLTPPLPRAGLGALATAAAFALGCGAHAAPMPASCVEGPQAIERALSVAPAPVRLHDGTSVSTCVDRARAEGDLQSLGAVLTQASADLARRATASDTDAVALGYLIGAVRRGATHSADLHAELARRVEQDAAASGPSGRSAALARGLRAGIAGG